RRQRELHAVVAHGDAVVHPDRVEQERDTPGRPYALLDEVAHHLEVDVAGDDVDVAVADRDERLIPVALADPGGPEQAAMGRAGVAALDRVGTHGRSGSHSQSKGMHDGWSV